MNISELYNQVAQLGFEDSIDSEERFIYAANRALLQVCKIKPEVSHYLLNHRPLENSVQVNTFSPIERAEDLTFLAESAKSYYLEADGNGILYIEKFDDGTGLWEIIGSVTLTSSGAFMPYKGFIKDGDDFVSGLVRLRLSGDYLYSVRNVAMYKNLLSASVSDIPPYEAYSRYNMRTLASDFLALCCPPIVEEPQHMTLNQEYQMEGESIILLPNDKKGVYKILYEHIPNKIVYTGDAHNDITEIDLDDELCSLLPILVAAYVWVEDEPQKSEYYMNLYRERVADIERKKVINKPVNIYNKSGW